MSDLEDFRWIVTAYYRGDLGVIDIEHHVDELGEIEALIERGPDWNCLDRIEIRLNPKCRSHDLTVEGAARL
jgi:hypothetical protein